MKWAVCYITNQFTAGANSTQRVESLNRVIHDCVKANSSLVNLFKEIQDIFNKKTEYVRMEEYKNQIPTIGLAIIPKLYFKSLEAIVDEYLLMPTKISVCKQMQECFFYDAFKLNLTDWNSIMQVSNYYMFCVKNTV